jgi:hypothetical protein
LRTLARMKANLTKPFDHIAPIYSLLLLVEPG